MDGARDAAKSVLDFQKRGWLTRALMIGSIIYATITEPVNADGRVDQFREVEVNLHPELKLPLKKLWYDPRTMVVTVSGGHQSVVEKNFEDYNIWLAVEYGVFIRTPNKKWIQNLTDSMHFDWIVRVKHVFEYFTERTPRSYYELRDTSLVSNYKYSDIELGRLQAKDMLQHMWTGPISNASVEVVQCGRFEPLELPSYQQSVTVSSSHRKIRPEALEFAAHIRELMPIACHL